VLPFWAASRISFSWFQSSPAPKGRCYWPAGRSVSTSPRMFQPSPAREGRCYRGQVAWYQATVCFNPHRPVRAGAMRAAARFVTDSCGFQPSPAREGRCYGPLLHIWVLGISFNPHRPVRAGAMGAPFSPPRVPAASFNPHRPVRAGAMPIWGATAAPSLAGPAGFNPHRPVRAGAIGHHSRCLRRAWRFNPHRPVRAGAMVDFRSGNCRCLLQNGGVEADRQGPLLRAKREPPGKSSRAWGSHRLEL